MKKQVSLPVVLNQLALDCVVATGTPPPHAARIFGILHTAMYDAWALYHKTPRPYRLGPVLRRPEAEHKKKNRRTAVTYAAFRVLEAYFQTALQNSAKKTLLTDAMQTLGHDPSDKSLDPTSPVGLGNLAAQAMLDYAAGDGANTWKTMGGDKPYFDYTGYKPAVKPDEKPSGAQMTRWQPLQVPQPNGAPPKTQSFLVPHWGLVKPFALRHGAEFRPVQGPEPHNTPRFKEQCAEILDISTHLSDTQKCISEYWANGPNSVTPPGHWCKLAAWVSKRDGHGLGRDIRLFFALANALMDAGIACWEAKRHFDYVRPVTAIRNLYEGKPVLAWGGPDYGGKRNMDGSEWHPYQPKYFVTPPFAEYPSGHSTFSAASAEILKRFTGSDLFGAETVIQPAESALEASVPSHPIVLKWRTFSEAAAEAGMSRLYGGIHFEDGNLDGLAMGRKIGEKVWDKCDLLWRGAY